MVISKTPLRVSFFGGGTDYPEYYEEHGGEVLSTSINQYVYVTVSRLNPLFEHRIRVAYSKTELVRTVSEIAHPCVRNALEWLGIDSGIEISVTTDLPARSGLGSSSSFTVGLLHALYAFKGKLVSQEQLALDAIHLEQKVIGEKVGSQDQVAAALGGFRRITFARSPVFRADPLPLSLERKAELQRHMLLFFTGITRFSEDVLDEQKKRTQVNLATLAAMREQVAAASEMLCGNAFHVRDFGRLLHEAWESKQRLSSKISNSSVNEAYDRARKAGAYGGKLLGAGGGGFLLVLAPPESHAAVTKALEPLVVAGAAFEDDGTRLIHLQLS
ncbi:MAG: hypothetical protein SFU85_13330 [Candidatus Methylacidiphilales bacterium]|nr:hypothetical protein [Candidatus Methylacidiphilales bacterium]